MAKLPELQISAVSAPRTYGPEVAVASARSRKGVVDETFRQVGQWANAVSKDRAQVATSDHKKAVNDYMLWASDKETLTPQELERIGIYDDVETQDFNGNELQSVPRHRWYATGLQKVMEDSRTRVTGALPEGPVRRAWEETVSQADDAALLRAYQAQAQDAFNFEAKQMDARFKMAMEAGDFEEAEGLMQTDMMQEIYKSNPALKEQQNLEIAKGKELFKVNQAIISGDPDRINELIDEWGDPEYAANSPLNNQEYLRTFSAMTSQRNAFEVQRGKAMEQAQDNLATELLVGLSTGQATLADVNENAFKLGTVHHSRLVNTARQISTSGVQTDPMTEQRFNAALIMLEAGLQDPGTNFDEAVSALQRQLLDATLVTNPDGSETTLLDPQAARSIADRLRNVKEFPYKTLEYEQASKDVYRLITGNEPDMMGSIAERLTGSTEGVAYVEAVQSLRSFVERNGGTAADISVWRRDVMPAFVEKAAMASVKKIDTEGTPYPVVVKNQNGRVSEMHSRIKIARLIRENASDPVAVREIQAASLRLDAWLNLYGDRYADRTPETR